MDKKNNGHYESIWLLLKFRGIMLVIAGLYIPPGQTWEERTETYDEINDIIMNTQEEGYTIVCAGDFNAHIYEMDEKGGTIRDLPDEAGKMLLEITQANNGTIWNRSKLCKGFFTRKPYGNQKGEKTVIDYVIKFGENARLQTMLIDDTGDHWWSSDHSMIITRMSARKVLMEDKDNSKIWKWNKGDSNDWQLYATKSA